MKQLEEGDKAPVFKGKDQDGNVISLKDFKGEKLVLYFYPKDDTPGCTAESCDLRDNYKMLMKKGYKVLGVSVDDEASHLKFIKKYKLPFPLLADTDKKVVNDYGVWVEKNMYGRKFWGIKRTTFIISEEGKIEKVFAKVDTKKHTEQILAQ